MRTCLSRLCSADLVTYERIRGFGSRLEVAARQMAPQRTRKDRDVMR